jgi:hypothetical protein
VGQDISVTRRSAGRSKKVIGGLPGQMSSR